MQAAAPAGVEIHAETYPGNLRLSRIPAKGSGSSRRIASGAGCGPGKPILAIPVVVGLDACIR